MATLKPRLTLTSTDASENSALSLTVSDELSVKHPLVGISTTVCSGVGGETIILPSVDATRWVYIKNTGVDGDGASTAAKISVEIADSTRIMILDTDEFCFFPHQAEAAGLIQLESSSGTVVAEYAYWTKA
tara:strand:- start:28 stop:420 length:393 start_codon:yes stop_codon:yes gene_type:complete